MKLYYHPALPYARKCRVVAREVDVKVDEVFSNPVEDEELRKLNPLKKIPILVLADGSTLFDSPVICEYIDHIGAGNLFPRSTSSGSPALWQALRKQALGDGMMDAAIVWRNENNHLFEARDWNRIRRCSTAIGTTIDALEAAGMSDANTIGEISVGCALAYLDLRFPDLGWRDGHPRIAEWYRQLEELPSMVETRL